MGLMSKAKEKLKQYIADRNEMHSKISAMTDRELKEKAVREGGNYADAWVKRRQREKELKDRIRGKVK